MMNADELNNEQCGISKTIAFWSSYIEMVKLLLQFIRATRTYNWEGYLASLRAMMPSFFFFADD